jgi:hypothetical protein
MVEIAFSILFQYKIALLSSKKDLDELRLRYKMSVICGTPPYTHAMHSSAQNFSYITRVLRSCCVTQYARAWDALRQSHHQRRPGP